MTTSNDQLCRHITTAFTAALALFMASITAADAPSGHTPRVVHSDSSDLIEFPGHQTYLLSDHTGTPSKAAILELTVPARTFGAPPHIHAKEDEHFYVLEGNVQFLSVDKTIDASAGALVVLPRGHLHGFWNVSDKPARMLLVVTPGEFASFFDAVVDEIRRQHPNSPAEVGAIIGATAAKYDVQVHPDKIPESARPLLQQ